MLLRRLQRLSTAVALPQEPSVLRWAVGGWSFFIAENVVLSHNRGALIEALQDESTYHALYGTVSTVATASIGYAYLFKVRGAKPLQWALGAAPPLWRLALGFGLQAFGLAAMAQRLPKLQVPVTAAPSSASGEGAVQQTSGGLRVQCPFDFGDKGSSDGPGPHGLSRVTRHPGFWSLGTVCLGAAVAVPSVPQALWLCGPAMVALIGGAHADFRHRRGMGGSLSAELDASTSNVPFAAMLSGAQGGVAEAFTALTQELKLSNASLGAAVALWLAVRRVR